MIPRSLGALLAGVASMALLAACAGVPEAGPVHRAPEPEGSESSATRFVPAGPTAGASPAEVVDGYVESMLGFPSDPRITASFLTDEAAEQWRPTGRTTVYSSISADVPDDDPDATTGSARVEVSERSTLDDNGRYVFRPSERSFSLSLIRQDGEWRIANPPNGMLVSERYFDDSVRLADVYFMDPAGERLIGDPVHVIDDDQAATRLVTALLSGPDDARAADLSSFVPEDQSLRGEVEVVDGLADVRLRQQITDLDEAGRERFVAQIAATLIQLDSIDSVRVTAPGIDEVVRSASLSELRPPARSTDVYAVDGDRLVRLSGGEVQDLDPPWDGVAVTARDVAVDARSERVALVEPDGVEVVGLEDAEPIVAVEGTAVAAVAWDADGALWVVDRADEDDWRVRLIEGDEANEIATGEWSMEDIVSFDLAPDGARYALVAESSGEERRLVSGAVERDVDGVVEGVGAPETIRVAEISDVVSVMWLSPRDLALTARVHGVRLQPVVVNHDGWRNTETVADRPSLPTYSAHRAVAIGPRSGDVYVEDDEGVWTISASRPWELLDGVRSPSRAR